jgi:hypothetical protein
LDEALFFRTDGICRAAEGGAGAGFDLDKGEYVAMPGDDVHLATVHASVVAMQDASAMHAEPPHGDQLAHAADFSTRHDPRGKTMVK